MDPSLIRLQEIMPPPASPRSSIVDWGRLEEGIGLTYPSSFKDFISVYGGTIWFDDLSPIYSEAKTAADVKKFLRSVQGKLKFLEGNIYDDQFTRIDLPLYPEKGGLFPFMIDFSSNLYCWKTEQNDSDKWPIVCWFTGRIRVLEKMTIAKMILDWLERKPRMVNVWGDIRKFPPDRIRLD